MHCTILKTQSYRLVYHGKVVHLYFNIYNFPQMYLFCVNLGTTE